MTISFAIEGPAAFIVMGESDKPNRLTNAAAIQMAEFIESAATARFVVITAQGPDFCAGRDFAGAPDTWSDYSTAEVRERNTEPVLRLLAAVRRSRLPVIAAVQGRAIGAGAGLAAVCDLTIAADDATFQLPEMGHGIPPCLAMSALLGRVSPKAILHLVYMAEPISAERARDIGIVSEVVPPDMLDARLEQVTSKMSGHAGPAVLAVKEYMRSAPAMDAQGAADFGSNLLAGVLSSAAPQAAGGR